MNSIEDTFEGDNSRFLRAIRFKVDKGLSLDPELEKYIEKFGFDRVVNTSNKGNNRENFQGEYQKFFEKEELCINGFPELLRYGLIFGQAKPSSTEYQGAFKTYCNFGLLVKDKLIEIKKRKSEFKHEIFSYEQLQGMFICLTVKSTFKEKGCQNLLEWATKGKSKKNLAKLLPKNRSCNRCPSKLLEEAVENEDPDLDIITKIAYDISLREFKNKKQISIPHTGFAEQRDSNLIREILNFNSDMQESVTRAKSSESSVRNIKKTISDQRTPVTHR